MSRASADLSWHDLEGELSNWRRENRIATLWWRDDDATIPDPALERLCALSARWQVPLSLAVVPARASGSLAELLFPIQRAQVLQHGYAHIDYGNGNEPAAELGDHRVVPIVLDELFTGREHLEEILSEFFLPVLVPPWNRISPALVPELARSGYTGLSCFSAREHPHSAQGVVLANCHVDPVHWKKGGIFRGEAKSLSALIAHLRERRLAQVDADEPTGVLTHHWSHDEATWAFMERLFAMTHDREDVCWLDAQQVFCGE
jgi:hypothetical protein